ncbi:MAG: hypothetical protein M3154_00720 [Candidatus Eremiobacteraeota bacterium]|nr:hypothetical protein [Candidatus Eremiobacteraeota bacterium]
MLNGGSAMCFPATTHATPAPISTTAGTIVPSTVPNVVSFAAATGPGLGQRRRALRGRERERQQEQQRAEHVSEVQRPAFDGHARQVGHGEAGRMLTIAT